MTLGLIVEGHGEVSALPVLVRRVATEILTVPSPAMTHPVRVPRSRVAMEGELERTVDLVARQVGAGGAILVLVDADADCPAALGPRMLERARSARRDRRVEVVLAVSEYESWFLAAASSLAGQRSLADDAMPPDAPESVRGAKEWLSRRMTQRYSERLDQPAFTARFDLAVARDTCPSFDKLVRALGVLLAA